MKHPRHILPLLLLAALIAAPGVRAQGKEADETALGIRQQGIQRLAREVEEKLFRLAEALEATEPENAKRLTKAVALSRRALIERRMGEIATLLDNRKLDAAAREQEKLLADLKRLIEVLTEDLSAEAERRRRLERLERWRAGLDAVLREQVAEKRESDQLADRDKALENLAARIERLEKIIAAQQRVAADTQKIPGKGLQALAEAADRQNEVRARTDALEHEMAAQPDASLPTVAPGRRALGEASGHQLRAEQALQAARPGDANDLQRKAVAALKRALDEMQQEHERLRALPQDHHRAAAKAQAATEQKAGALSDDMGREGTGQAGQPGGEGGESSPQASRQALDQARQAMKQAEQQLRAQKPGDASAKQQQAIERLQKARQALDRVLAQLRQEEQEQILAALETYFREMLERQRPINLVTAALDAARADGWARADTLKCAELAEEQQRLVELAAKVHDILSEEGTTVVFPTIVAGLRDDMRTVRARLADEKTGEYTRAVEAEIARTLEDLIAAMEKQRRETAERRAGSPPPSGPQKLPPLVSSLAELKMLRITQKRVNRLTRSVDAQRRAAPEDETLPGDVEALAERQAEVVDMARELVERL